MAFVARQGILGVWRIVTHRVLLRRESGPPMVGVVALSF